MLANISKLEIEPIAAIAASTQDAALAIICGIDGPSYRPLGATMSIFEDETIVGNLSSGCIEADIALHAKEVLLGSAPMQVRYGKGSPFIDIKLPCGGGIDVLIVPRPDREVLREIVRRYERREHCSLRIDRQFGSISAQPMGATGTNRSTFAIEIEPTLRFLILGAGPEVTTFAAIVQSMGFPNTVFSPDRKTLNLAEELGCETRELVSKNLPRDLEIDNRTAATLFFHDHDWEPPLLVPLLASDAFFVGAQGSRKSAEARLSELEILGVNAEQRSRLRGPIGLIPSTRNAYTLAVSVLAEILFETS